MRELSDVKFLQAVAQAQIPPALFGHREHLRLAFLLLRRDGEEEGTRNLVSALRRYTAAHGIGHIFDEPLTLRWVARLLSAMASASDATSLDALLAAAPELANAKADKRSLETLVP